MTEGMDRDTANLTVQILREIREEGRKTNARLDQTNARLDGLRQSMEEGFHLLDRRMDNVLPGARKESHEELQRRVSRLEGHLGLDG